MKTIINTAITIAILTFSIITGYTMTTKTPEEVFNLHSCNWEDCNYQNKSVTIDNFKSTWGYEEDTDGFYVELTHIAQPQWAYEECEQYVFEGVE